MINDVKFESPSLPVLLQVLSGAFRPDELLPRGSVYPLPVNATIEITMTGGGKKGWEVRRAFLFQQWSVRMNLPRSASHSSAWGTIITLNFGKMILIMM